MDINTYVEAIATAIAGSSTLSTWCNTNFGKAQTVFIGTDVRNEPEQADYPCVRIFPSNMASGYAADAQSREIIVTCGIYKDELVTSTTNLKKYTGVSLIETFRQKVEAIISGMTDANRGGRIDNLDVDYEPVEFYPFFLSGMSFELTKDLYQGDNPFA